jgi:hypothetical protein
MIIKPNINSTIRRQDENEGREGWREKGRKEGRKEDDITMMKFFLQGK